MQDKDLQEESLNEEVAENLEDARDESLDAQQEDLSKKDLEIEELNTRLLRVAADFENYKRRTEKNKEDMIRYGNEKLVLKLLDVIDNFERALNIETEDEKLNSFLEGMKMIYKQFVGVLENDGLEKIEALGNPFDPEKHEAVMQEASAEVKNNIVLEDFRTGYIFNGKVIRPSMVKVAKN